MTFEEAGRQFAALQAQFRGGQIPLAQFQQTAAQLRVQDAAGRWWQIEPNSAQWMMWDGARWLWPQQAAAAAASAATSSAATSYAAQPQARAQATIAQQPMPQASATVAAKKAAPAIWEGLAPVLPGFAIGLAQSWPTYSKDTALLAGFAIPSLLPALLVPLVPYIGRWIAIGVVIGCLGWLSWPVVSQLGSIVGNAQAVQSHAGRGLVGVSLLYLIPRIWKIR